MARQQQTIGKVEFIALMAMLVATVALSIDGMLPALPQMALDLVPEDPNKVQFVLASFIIGMGIGTLVVGPLSDSFGRKTVILWGALLYIVAALACLFSTNIEMLLFARCVQGIGASAPRVVTQALVRDLYSGREMAKISSFIMMIFTLIPAIAPLVCSGIIALYGWRGVFGVFIAFVVLGTVWMQLRIKEPINTTNRRPFRIKPFKDALRDMAALPLVRLSIATQVFCYAILFLSIMIIHPVFDVYFERADSFPLWFAFIAILAGSASFLNAVIVMKFGMRRLINGSILVQLCLSIVMVIVFVFVQVPKDLEFFIYVFWLISVFFSAGMTLGNLTALALEPLGHIAGTATSIMGAIATLGSTVIAGTIGQFFDGTPMAHIIGVCSISAIALFFSRKMRKYDRVKTV